MGQNVLHNQTSKARRNNARIAQLLLLWLVLSSVVYLVSCRQKPAGAEADQLTRLTNLGKSQLDSGDPAKAVELFRQALALDPTLPEAQLNLANALLLANQPAAWVFICAVGYKRGLDRIRQETRFEVFAGEKNNLDQHVLAKPAG